MLRNLRWQIALAAAGIAVIAGALALLSNRAFEDRPARGGELVEAVVGAPATLHPLLANSPVELDVSRLLFSGLTRIDVDGRIQPDLASRWSVSDDGRRYTFHLRPNAQWHDGEPLDAEDVLVTAWLARDEGDRLGTERNPLAFAWELADVRALDAHTIEIELAEPYAPFLEATTLGLVPAHIFGDVPPEQVARHPASTREPVGAGPWRLLQPGGLDAEQIRLARFDDHWRADDRAPLLDGVVLRFYPTTQDALAALGRREVQSLGGLGPQELDRLGPDVTQHNAVMADYTLVFLNPAKQLFTESSVRRALAMGLDRAGIIAGNDLLAGQAVEADGPIAPGPWGASLASTRGETAVLEHDPEGARTILEEAGWIDSDGDAVRDRDGRPLRFALEAYNEPLSRRIAERMRDDWAAIGVDVELRLQSQPNMVRALSDRAYDAALYGVAARFGYTPDPYAMWHSSQARSGQNFAAWSNEETDAILEALRTTPPDQTATLRALYGRLEEIFRNEQPALLLYHPVYTYVTVDPALGGVELPRLMARPADRYATMPNWFLRTERIFLGER